MVMGDSSTVTEDTNPCAWYREHHKEVPLLAAYFKAHGAFPATSTSAERVFNMDGIILTRTRYIARALFCKVRNLRFCMKDF